jgi:hypothetical protein
MPDDLRRVTGFGGDPGASSHASDERAQGAAPSPAPTPHGAVASSPDRHGSSPTLLDDKVEKWPDTVWSLTGEEYRYEKDMYSPFISTYYRVQSDGTVNRNEVFERYGGGLTPYPPPGLVIDFRDLTRACDNARFPVSAQRPHLPELPARESGAAQFPEPNAAHTTLQQSAPGSSFRGAEPAGGLPNQRSDSPQQRVPRPRDDTPSRSTSRGRGLSR